MGFTASSNPYFISDGAPPLTVSWERDDDPVEIWERFSKASPSRFVKRNLNDEERKQRIIKVQLKKGEVYRAALYERNSDHPDPNVNLTDPPPNDLVTIVGVVDQHRDLISLPDNVWGGGTFIETLMTTPSKCFALMQVGTTEPVVIPTPTKSGVEFRQISKPDAEARSFNATSHPLECKPLVPGEHYSYVLLAVDEDGFWDCKVDVKDCLWREVEITLTSIFVRNDGDPGGVGQAQFWVTVYEAGSAVPKAIVKTFELGDDKYEVTTGQDIPLPANWKVTIGPKKINPQVDSIVAVHTNGLEYDGIEGTEKAGSDGYDKRLVFPSGRGLEEVDDGSETVRAYPLEDDDFEYRVRFEWKVKYIDPSP